MIETPKIDAFAASSRHAKNFPAAKNALTSGVANQQIFNQDFVAARENISRVVGEAIEYAQETSRGIRRGEGEGHPTWDNTDPRWSIIYTPQFNNLPGAVKKLQKFKGEGYIDVVLQVMEEGAALAEMVKNAKPYIVKGRKPPVLTDKQKIQIERDKQNTGVCPVCMRRQKLTFDGKMVAHGYELKWGMRNGICFGAGCTAWELSPEGAVEFVAALKHSLQRAKETLANMEAGKVNSVNGTKREKEQRFGYSHDVPCVYKRGEDGFEKALVTAQALLRRDIGGIKATIPEIESRIKAWKQQPLQFGGAETQDRWKSKFLNEGNR
jgi:hypothetical protein